METQERREDGEHRSSQEHVAPLAAHPAQHGLQVQLEAKGLEEGVRGRCECRDSGIFSTLFYVSPLKLQVGSLVVSAVNFNLQIQPYVRWVPMICEGAVRQTGQP